MPEWLAVILLGVIEGITEFLPISSTGHLLLVEQYLPRQSDLFNVVIQAGAVLAVIPLFPERMAQIAQVRRWQEPATRDYLLKWALAFGLTCAGGFLWDKLGKKLPEEATPVALALFIGGIGFVVVEQWLKKRQGTAEVTWPIALAVGVGQLLAAIFPGLSRSGATILLALLLGMNRPAATEFSFLVGIPTMLAASSLKIFKAVHHPPPGAAPENWGLVLLGTLVSAVVSFVVVKWLLRFVQTHTFTWFGWYRIALGALVLWLGQ
ncbi:undecaprenyl-diphosphate phosphatase [Fontisphaera persica]|uniref:undecaprenyl-diphosphate phosphatase n=1 Tax=Fontisphaera persica TaxID=2974023 RepID=UPI0024BF38DA|nr:undecaprenyl-diphosphate phosphatase [Fontisphaera persica]WCJ61218.1 undecaprenyl-diphosphate phosphatase [Fontisphaera persica]